MNWYTKIARYPGASEDIAQEYSEGKRPYNEDHKKDPRAINLTTPVPQFGGNGREGYPDDLNSFNSHPSEEYKNRRRLPGENVLMDTFLGEGVRNEEFTLEEDKLPKGDISNMLDKGISPNKEKDVYKRIKNKIPKKNIF